MRDTSQKPTKKEAKKLVISLKRSDTIKKAEISYGQIGWSECPHCKKAVIWADPETQKKLKKWKKY